jgi:hypothetical protein
VVVAVLERDPRCKMITLDPDTARPSPCLLRKVTRDHEGMAGIYAAVLVEGTVRPGDAIELLSRTSAEAFGQAIEGSGEGCASAVIV